MSGEKFPIKVSLVIATVDRVHELDCLLASLARQSWKQFEIIFVDQNKDGKIDSIVDKWRSQLKCVHLHSDIGASRARNVGISQARGSIIGFPDDDCWYPADLLSSVSNWFDTHIEFDFFCCSIQDENYRDIASRWPSRSGEITRNSVLRACACSSLFIRRNAVIDAKGFDEGMGPGPKTIVKSAEEIDLVIRLMHRASRGWFERSFHVFHPRREAGSATSARGFIYGKGFGFLLRKHRYPVYIWIYHVIRPLGGSAWALFNMSPKKMLFYLKSSVGRATGFFMNHNDYSM